ncbi:hypothetical protein VTN31DRAFT_5313 [Thermomyces dupontii]|uniref:uncharacterized protein n=1 Tax=Talaromyces thermophilus TaxID=28565 RepID=UPI003741F618
MHTIQRLDQRIPALNFHYTIVENKVVIAPQFQRKSSPVYVWDLSSNKIKEIGSFRYLIFCHMDTADNVLVTFEIRGTELLLPPDVQQTKWTTTTGHLLERKVFPLPRPADSLSAYQVDWCSNPWDHWNSWDTWDTFNTFGHRTVAQSKSFWHGNYSGPVYLEYDHAIDRLTIRRIDCTKLVNKFGRYHSAYLTRNLVYRCCSETMELVVHNTATDTATFHSISEQFEREALVRRGNILDFIHVFGDREVFGFAVKTGVHLWFFNPNFAPDLTTTG